MDRADVQALEQAARLQSIGVVVRSAEIAETAAQLRAFGEAGGNRAMRRAAKRVMRGKGRR